MMYFTNFFRVLLLFLFLLSACNAQSTASDSSPQYSMEGKADHYVEIIEEEGEIAQERMGARAGDGDFASNSPSSPPPSQSAAFPVPTTVESEGGRIQVAPGFAETGGAGNSMRERGNYRYEQFLEAEEDADEPEPMVERMAREARVAPARPTSSSNHSGNVIDLDDRLDRLGDDREFDGNSRNAFAERPNRRQRSMRGPQDDGILTGFGGGTGTRTQNVQTQNEQARGRQARNDSDQNGYRSSLRNPFRSRSQERDNFVVSNFLNEEIDDLSFQEASGYWDNTYVPGDPTLRALHGQLQVQAINNEDPDVLDDSESGLSLSSRSTMYAQPFDPPESAAMAVYLHSDRVYVDGETRMIVQVGLQGAIRNHGQRPAMNIVLVLDLRETADAERQEMIETLLETLRLSYDTGDVFSVLVAGARGGLLIPPGELGYGAISVAIEQLFEDETVESLRRTSLTEAVTQAIELVSSEDLATPLGSSLILIATPGLTQSDRFLERQVHQASVDGIMTSILGLGLAEGGDLLDRIALAGQGNRREALDNASVEQAVENELAAAGRVVARAVRLRIRLAPGVRLVQMFGSHSLDEMHSQRVRNLEQSVDQRLSASLGIQSDRGEDEAGIQIVIPAYYAGDAHVFLLDVVAERPGPIADVTVRYKDLIYLDNAIARDAISLARNIRSQGPLETNVIKNVIGFHLAEALKNSATFLERGDLAQAQQTLRDISEMLSHAYHSNSALDGDPELAADLAMISDYLSTLENADEHSRQQEIAASLRYAAYLKHQRPLDGLEGARTHE